MSNTNLNIIQQYVKKYKPSFFTDQIVVSGVFDLIHRGHIDLINKAKYITSHGVTALINSDISVEKNNRFTIINELERLDIIKNFVQHAFLFDEPTPKEALEIIKPYALCKGIEYLGCDLPELENLPNTNFICIETGIRTHTSDIINRVENYLVKIKRVKRV